MHGLRYWAQNMRLPTEYGQCQEPSKNVTYLPYFLTYTAKLLFIAVLRDIFPNVVTLVTPGDHSWTDGTPTVFCPLRRICLPIRIPVWTQLQTYVSPPIISWTLSRVHKTRIRWPSSDLHRQQFGVSLSPSLNNLEGVHIFQFFSPFSSPLLANV